MADEFGQPTAWSDGQWRQRMQSALRELGHLTLTEFLEANPSLTYLQVAEALGPLLAAIQVRWVQMEEANASGRRGEAAADALVRVLRERFRKGWGKKPRFESRAAGAFADWSSMVAPEEGNRGLMRLEESKRIWEALKSLQPDEGWIPTSRDDHLIRHAMRSVFGGNDEH